MKRSGTSVRKDYRHHLAAGMSETLPAGLFSALGRTPGRRWLARLVVWVAILMAWNEASTQQGRFQAARRCVQAMFPSRRAVGKTVQGFTKRLRQLHAALLATVTGHLRKVLQEMAGPYWRREGQLAFAVDGSRIECPRTKANEAAFGHAGKMGCGPQMWLTTLWHMGTGLPWAWQQGRSDESERNHLRQLLALLPPAALLVGDAGFVGYELLSDILAGGRSFLMRVGGNITLLQELGWVKRFGAETIYLWPVAHRDQPPLVLRLLVLQRQGKSVYLLTNLPEESLSLRQAAVLYGMRWGIEVFYRSLKQTLQHRTMRSRAPRQAEAELAWALVGLLVMGLMSVREILGQRRDPLGWSVAATRDLIRQALCEGRQRRLSPKGWRARLAGCRKDTYVRTASKAARDWPDRKHERPPGPPKLRTATAPEVQRAQALSAQQAAA